MTIEDIYLSISDDQIVTLISDKFTWHGKGRYIPSDFMEYEVISLYVGRETLIIDIGKISD